MKSRRPTASVRQDRKDSPSPRATSPLQRAANSSAQVRSLQAMQNLADRSPIMQRAQTIAEASDGQREGDVPIQRTIDGGTNETKWAEKKSSKKTMQTKLKEFARQVHYDDLVFDEAELDGFHNDHMSGKSHDELSDSGALYRDFKRWVAQSRDSEGAHGAERHGGSGDKFIVDRANSGGANPASYLKIDEWLKWDTILRLGAEDIFDAYSDLAKDSIGHLSENLVGARNDGSDATVGDLAAAPVRAAVFDKNGENFFATRTLRDLQFGDENWGASLRTYLMRGQAQGANAPYKLKVRATIVGDGTMKSRSVHKVGGAYVSTHDVVEGNKYPEAHTGGLSPEFEISDDATIATSPSNASDLKWVTKY